MHIEELDTDDKEDSSSSSSSVGFDLKSGNFVVDDDQSEEIRVRVLGNRGENDVVWDTKRVLIGVGGRFLFYPTLLYNVIRNKCQAEFRWWDRIDQFVLLGAVPFPGDVLLLKELGVHGVVTLNEPYETLVPKTFYHAHGIDNLVLPTRDYLFAPSMNDICQAVDFIHRNASRGWMTYVHCKAGRGRSTTIVLCYLVQHKQMTPEDAYSYVRSIRPRVLLARPQRQAVDDFYNFRVKTSGAGPRNDSLLRNPGVPSMGKLFTFDDRSVVVVTTTDLDGYDPSHKSVEGGQVLTDVNVIYKARVVGQAALARLSCLWLRCQTQQKIAEEQLQRKGSCTIRAEQISANLTVDIHVY